MTHLLLCREYPPAPYPAGGIGTYARHIARLLAEAGETVHMVGQRWEGAPDRIVTSHEGRLNVHRISLEEPIFPAAGEESAERELLKLLARSSCPSQLFSWQAARYAEHLLAHERIDVIEAQEWEAPLYYLLARRAAGLGPARRPPCLVHLHSPSEMVFQHNEWDLTLTDVQPLLRFEEYCIRSADALLCPSRYLADQVAERYEIEPERIEVIPYAMGQETPVLERSPEVWARNAICFVGRLELRKGVIEWVDAAVEVAKSESSVSFDFFGSDTSLNGGVGASVQASLQRRIPAPLRSRFRFHGSTSRGEVIKAMGQSAVAVVPSRWENFPFTCIEAMSTGLPVLGSPNGGMAEMIVDRESGWLTMEGSAEGLASGLRRVLATPAHVRQAMGQSAAERIRRICNNEVIVASHIALRKRLVSTGARRSLHVSGLDGEASKPSARHGMGIIVTCAESPARLKGCIDSLQRQSRTAEIVVVIDERLEKAPGAATLGSTRQIYTSERKPEAMAQLGLRALLIEFPNLQSVVQLDQDVRLEPNWLSVCDGIFMVQPAVGIVSPWLLRQGRRSDLDPGPSPTFLDKFALSKLPQCSMVRIDALQHPERRWAAYTFPGPMATILPPAGSNSHPRANRRYSGMALIQSPSARFALLWFMSAPLIEKLRWLGHIARRPKRLLVWVGWRVRMMLAKTAQEMR